MDYNNTFSKRCRSYAYAVSTYPEALRNEFQTAVEELNLQPTDILLNIPASCIPLTSYYTVQPKYTYEFETNEEFASLTNIPICSFYNIPLPNASVSKIISLASLHHMSEDERPVFYRECKRVLMPGGELVIGDVKRESKQADWLNTFVNQYNSSGHKGIFFSEEDCIPLQKEGFITSIKEREYTWNFNSTDSMIDFTKHLFGLDLATDQIILNGLQEYLQPNNTLIDWKLIYIHAKLQPI